MSSDKRIIITHCVDPHNFYFKYAEDCVNTEYSSFDYVLQCYGNGLHDRQMSTAHHPVKNELIIFFDVISNKWIRGRVINVNGDEVTVWCIDNGIIRKTDAQFIQPLSEDLKKDFNIVQLGGVSVLPAENTLNFDTLNVKMQVRYSWDKEMTDNFKVIVDSAKRINFIEEMKLEEHKFGTLTAETRKDKVVVINEILLQMSKAIACDESAGITTYMLEKRMQEDFHQSLEKATTLSNAISSRRSSSTGSRNEITNPFKSDTISGAFDNADRMQSKGTSKLCGTDVRDDTGKSTKASSVAGRPQDPSSRCDKSEVDSIKPEKSSGATGTSNGIELLLEPVASSTTTSTSNKTELRIDENPFSPKPASGASKQCDSKSVKSKAATSISSKSKNTHGAPCEWSDKTKQDLVSVKPTEAAETSFTSEMKINENPFKPKKPFGASGKGGSRELQSEPANHKENASKSDQPIKKVETSQKLKETPIAPSKSAVTEPDSASSEISAVKSAAPIAPAVKCDREPVEPKTATSKTNKSKTENEGNSLKLLKSVDAGKPDVSEKPKETAGTLDENPFKPMKTSGGTGTELGFIKLKSTIDTSDRSGMEVQENPFKPKTPYARSGMSDGIKLHLEPVTSDGTKLKCDTSKTGQTLKPEADPLIPKSGSSKAEMFLQGLEPVNRQETGAPKKSEVKETDNPFTPGKSSTSGVESSETESDVSSVKRKGATFDKFEMGRIENPFKPKKPSGAAGMSDGIKLLLEPVEPERTTQSKIGDTFFNFKPKNLSEESSLRPVKPVKASGTVGKSELKLDGDSMKLNGKSNGMEPQSKNVQPKETLNHSPESNADMNSTINHRFKHSDHSPVQNGLGSIQNADERGSDHNSLSDRIDLPSLDGSIHTLDTISMAVSTIRTFINEAAAHRNKETPRSVHIDYDCHLKTLKFGSGKVMRRPLQSSIGWINQQRFPVADDIESCNSSIINLMDD